MSIKTLFVFRNIEKSFDKNRVLLDVNISLEESKCVLLSGKNGSGKSTLLKIIAGLEKPDKAEIQFSGKSYKWRNIFRSIRKNIIYLHQQPFLFSGTVISNISYGLRFSSLNRSERQAALYEALEWSGLIDLGKSQAKNLSGGIQQRVAFARAWILRPKVLLLDEPMSNMDNESREKTCLLLDKMKSNGSSLVITSHVSNYLNDLVNSYIYLSEGKLKEGNVF